MSDLNVLGSCNCDCNVMIEVCEFCVESGIPVVESESEYTLEPVVYEIDEDNCCEDPKPKLRWINPIMFLSIYYDVLMGRNNDPTLVLSWYLFCGYLIVSYSAVILWFLL